MEINHPTHEESHAHLAARAEQRAKVAEAKLSQSLSDNQSMLLALNSERVKNDQLAQLIEEQSEEITRVKRDLQWYISQHQKQLKSLATIKKETSDYPYHPVFDTYHGPSDEMDELKRVVAEIRSVCNKFLGSVAPF